MGFFTIFIPDGLSEADYKRARRQGPGYVNTRRRNHQSLLAAAGFADVEEIDLTKEFLMTQRGWRDGRERFREELMKAEGKALFEERQLDAKSIIDGVEGGLLRRALFLCS
jgi:hypothetical protein